MTFQRNGRRIAVDPCIDGAFGAGDVGDQMARRIVAGLGCSDVSIGMMVIVITLSSAGCL